MPRTLSLLFVIINLALIVYLALPLPNAPNLPNSILSTDPGDTVQLKNVKAFYTNDYRDTVMPYFYKALKQPYIRINHPPEKAKDIFRDTIQSYYLEEFVFPLKGSLFVNGYEWEHDVFSKPEKREVNKMIVNGQDIKSKVTLRWFYPNLFSRYLNLFAINIFLLSTYFVYKSVFFKNDN